MKANDKMASFGRTIQLNISLQFSFFALQLTKNNIHSFSLRQTLKGQQCNIRIKHFKHKSFFVFKSIVLLQTNFYEGRQRPKVEDSPEEVSQSGHERRDRQGLQI
jgi:hypothetical protein